MSIRIMLRPGWKWDETLSLFTSPDKEVDFREVFPRGTLQPLFKIPADATQELKDKLSSYFLLYGDNLEFSLDKIAPIVEEVQAMPEVCNVDKMAAQVKATCEDL